jgi:hypothetical protein
MRGIPKAWKEIHGGLHWLKTSARTLSLDYNSYPATQRLSSSLLHEHDADIDINVDAVFIIDPEVYATTAHPSR